MILVSLCDNTCARCVSLCIRDLERKESWLLAAESLSGSVTSLRAQSRSTSGIVADRDLGETLLGLVEGVASVAHRDCDKLYYPP